MRINEIIRSIMNRFDPINKATLMEIMIANETDTRLNQVRDLLEEHLKSAPFSDSDEYVNKFQKLFQAHQCNIKLGNINILRNNIGGYDLVELTRFFSRIVPQLKDSTLKYFREHNNKGVTLIDSMDYQNGIDPAAMLLDRIIGCRARCPFCDAPCEYSQENHERDRMSLQHRPVGIKGVAMRKNQLLQLCTYNCNLALASDICFIHDEAAIPYKQYKEYYPKWEIKPDREMESPLFWKWFMNKFNDAIAKYFGAKPAKIPAKWRKITWAEAKTEYLEKHQQTDYYSA